MANARSPLGSRIAVASGAPVISCTATNARRRGRNLRAACSHSAGNGILAADISATAMDAIGHESRVLEAMRAKPEEADGILIVSYRSGAYRDPETELLSVDRAISSRCSN